jgi:D-alanine-D-alanine ligase
MMAQAAGISLTDLFQNMVQMAVAGEAASFGDRQKWQKSRDIV